MAAFGRLRASLSPPLLKDDRCAGFIVYIRGCRQYARYCSAAPLAADDGRWLLRERVAHAEAPPPREPQLRYAAGHATGQQPMRHYFIIRLPMITLARRDDAYFECQKYRCFDDISLADFAAAASR